METVTFEWSCKHTWKQSAKNTAWCLLGCAIGDFGTIFILSINKNTFSSFGYNDISNYKWINNQYNFRDHYFD